MSDPKDQLPLLFRHIIFEPRPDETYYHYCSLETLRLICESKPLRFGDINMMNDYGENTWGYRIFESAATYLLQTELPNDVNGMDKAFFDDVDRIFAKTQFVQHPLLFSLSRKPDVLSQWRAYAEDGCGVAIGFSGAALSALPVTIIDVEYDEKAQVAEMAEALALVYIAEARNGHSRGSEFREMCFHLSLSRTFLKNPAFAEEQEVRCIHMLSVETDDGRPRLVDKGGELHGTEHPGQPVKFRTHEHGVIAYVDYQMAMGKVAQPIKEVWLGPKNFNAAGNVVYMMSASGLKEYEIKRSKASYR